MSEECEARCAENIYDAIKPDAVSFRSGNISIHKPTENGAHNMDDSHCGVTDNTYEGLNRNKSVNRTYDNLQNDQVQEQKIRKNPKKTYLIVGIISFLIGSVLAGSVVFVVMKLISSSLDGQPEQLIQGDDMKLDLKLDRSTLHSSKYISDNGVILSNHESDQTPISGYRIQDYKGASGNIYVKNNTVIYYEVSYEYTIHKVLVSTNLLLEVGLAPRHVLLNHGFVGNVKNGWSFALARCGNSDNICIRAKHNGNLKVYRFVSANLSGKTVKGIFEVMIDMEEHTFSLTQNRTRIYTFENIPSSSKLYPVFGVYHELKVNAQLNILNAMNLTNLPNKNIIHLFTGYEDNNKFMVPRDTNYFPTRSGGK